MLVNFAFSTTGEHTDYETLYIEELEIKHKAAP